MPANGYLTKYKNYECDVIPILWLIVGAYLSLALL